MTTLQIKCSRNYQVHIGHGILSQAGQILQQLTQAEICCIISDSNIAPLYTANLESVLRQAGYRVVQFIFPAGESSKNLCVYADILRFLAENGLGRKDCILALGGGVTGDLAGFAAASYLRGIPYIQIPTTLLAMVDSSVGGKTGLDLPQGKNLVGAFYQPSAVLCDLDTLDSIPTDTFVDGCAEVIKYAALFDKELFHHLEEKSMDFDRQWVITRCIQWKRDTVQQDEYDQGKRMLLNFGHTIGHSVETCSDYRLSHGRAVAIGMAVIARATRFPGWDDLLSLLQKFALPTTTSYSVQELLHAATHDKKRSGELWQLILPAEIGLCRLVAATTAEFEQLLKEGI